MHPFFRDAMIYKVAPGQWLLYATGRGKWFSRIDIYQSFDLVHWQYIRPAIRCGWGSEKNFVTGSMESPYLFNYGGNYYLSTTYNNDSFFWTAILLQMGIILNRKDYNKTLVFGSHNPYDFGLYNGKRRSSQLVSQLETHAPVYVQSGERWYLTTCGWPFAASLTGGEAAWAELKWDDGE
jgi:sucrose-6-phosphate hydrolase SacC (GH32 family)